MKLNTANISKRSSCPTRLEQHRHCFQIRLINNCRSQSFQRKPLFPYALSITTSSNKSRGAVLVLPGFLFGSKPYLGLANSLQQRGYAAEIVPVNSRDWWPILLGGDFLWYLRRIDDALTKLYNKNGSVAIIGHSAGGWVARILLGEEVPYQGHTFIGRRKKVHSLVTLGTPHASIEAYPFGRVPEKLVIADLERREKSGGGGGSGSGVVAVPDSVKGSSLQFANYFYPDASFLPGVQVVCAVGDAITGAAPAWRDKKNKASPQNVNKYSIKLTDNDRWLAYEGYKSGCGDGTVPGDGVTPVCIAHLPGAENIILPGVWHGPKSTLPDRPWYGDDVILDTWVKYLNEGYRAP